MVDWAPNLREGRDRLAGLFTAVDDAGLAFSLLDSAVCGRAGSAASVGDMLLETATCTHREGWMPHPRPVWSSWCSNASEKGRLRQSISMIGYMFDITQPQTSPRRIFLHLVLVYGIKTRLRLSTALLGPDWR